MKKTAWLAFALALALALNGLALAQGAQVAPITAAEAVERFNGGTYSAFVDVRAQADYDAGHIPTAVTLPLEQLAQAAAEAPGSTSTATPASRAAATSRSPGSDTPGMPASEQ